MKTADINIGIVGIGACLPDEVRQNDWWPDQVVEAWREKADKPARLVASELRSEGEGRVAAALAESLHDPFQGAVERRVLSEDRSVSSMEIEAAEDALVNAGVGPEEVKLVLCWSGVPDYLGTNVACTIHKALGLPREAISLGIEGACNSFPLQLAMAEELIRAGRTRYALLVQGCCTSRVAPYDQPFSAMFGDGATAVVVGPVSGRRGILGSAHVTDGGLQNTMVLGIPNKRWYEEGRVVFYPANMLRALRLFLATADLAEEVVGSALEDAGLGTTDVGFYACHQGTAWLRQVTQAHLKLDSARTIDTFPWAASLSGANIPLVLWAGQREGLLRDDDIVLTFAGGGGMTCSSFVIRWGR